MQNKDKVEETLTLNNVPEYDIEDYDLNVPKVFAKFISNVEKIVRNSFEYKQLVSFLRNYMNMNQCSFYKYVSNEENFNIKIHRMSSRQASLLLTCVWPMLQEK